LIYLLIQYYNKLFKLKKKNGVITVSSVSRDEESLELVETNTYRRYSIDDDNLETNTNANINTNIIMNQKIKKGCNKILHYFLFSCLLLTFKYLFFKNVVLVYDPLSYEEVKFIIYKKILHKLEEDSTNIAMIK